MTRPILITGGEFLLLFVRFDIDDVIGLEVIGLGVEEGATGEIKDNRGGLAALDAHDYNIVSDSIHGEITTHSEGFEDGEAVAGDMEFLRGSHLSDYRNSEVHGTDGDDGIVDIAFGLHPVFYPTLQVFYG